MKIVLDTNVLLSGLFFGGVPRRIVEACIAGRVQLIATPEIWAEYDEAATELAKDHALPALSRMMLLLASRVALVTPGVLEQPICRDPDDDKFIAAALSAGVQYIVSGDKDLRVVHLPGLLTRPCWNHHIELRWQRIRGNILCHSDPTPARYLMRSTR